MSDQDIQGAALDIEQAAWPFTADGFEQVKLRLLIQIFEKVVRREAFRDAQEMFTTAERE